jgi:hypothetical protein
MKTTFAIIGIAVLVIFFLIFGPLLTIWALNTLFPALAIAYTWQTWAAIVLLGMWVRGLVDFRKNK